MKNSSYVNSIRLLSVLFFLMITSFLYSREQHIVVVIPSYNNKEWYIANLESVLSQNYTNFEIVYVDDCSQDGMSELVREYINQYRGPIKITLVRNTMRCKALRNLYYAIHSFVQDDDICCIVDGDDNLIDNMALQKVNEAYQRYNVLLTYGNFKASRNGLAEWCKPIPSHLLKNNTYRRGWYTGPLRTFKGRLFKMIKLKSLLYEGAFFSMTYDVAMVSPMLELSGGKIHFIADIMYWYNEENIINDGTVNITLQQKFRDIIWKRKPYKSFPIPLNVSKRLLAPAEISVILFYKSNVQELEKAIEFYKMIGIKKINVLYAATDQESHQYMSDLKQKYSYVLCKTYIHATETLQELVKTSTDIKGSDFCIICLDIVDYNKKDLERSIRLLRQTKSFMIVHSKTDSEELSGQLLHTSLLEDNIFTFQLGWKPELPINHYDYEYIIPTKKLVKYNAILPRIWNDLMQLKFGIKNKQLQEKTGLIFIK